MGVQAQADFGRLDPARGAAHQLHADRLFKLFEVVTDVGPRHLEIARSLAQVAGINDVDQQG